MMDVTPDSHAVDDELGDGSPVGSGELDAVDEQLIARLAGRARGPIPLDALVSAQRPLLSRRRRFAARLSPAARHAAMGARRRPAVGVST